MIVVKLVSVTNRLRLDVQLEREKWTTTVALPLLHWSAFAF